MLSHLLIAARTLAVCLLTVLVARPAVAEDEGEDLLTPLEVMMEQMRELDEESDKMFEEFFKDDRFSNSQNVFDDFDRAQQEFLKQIPQQQKPLPLPPLSVAPKQLKQSTPQLLQPSGVNGDPTITQEESAEHVSVHIQVPGMDQNSVNIKVDETTIRVMGSAEKQQKHFDAQGGVTQQTSYTSRFQRVLPIPEGVDSKGMDVKKTKDEIVLIFPKR